MPITRRHFIQGVTGAAAFLIAGNGLQTAHGQKKSRPEIFPLPPEVYSQPLYSMTAKQFEAYIGKSFTVAGEDGRAWSVTLTEVNVLERMGNTVRGYYGESFSLIFEGRDDSDLPQGTYDLSTDGLPTFSSLIVPTGRRQRQFELIVNRITR